MIEADVKAGEEQYVSIDFPDVGKEGEYSYNVSMMLKEDVIWAERGHEIAFGQCIKTYGRKNKVSLPIENLRVIHGDVNIGIKGKDFSALFSKQEGGLISLRYDGKEYITRVPKTTFWRATTDNDKGFDQGFHSGLWQTAGMYQKVTDFHMKESVEGVTLQFQYSLPIKEKSNHTVTYKVVPGGKIYVTLQFHGIEGFPEMPAYGMEFKLKSQYNRMKYYGFGPEENYIDRNHGARLGIFKSTSSDNMSRYLIPQECGNRTNVRWLTVTNKKQEGLRFGYVTDPFECSVLPYSAYELENAMHREELPKVNYTWVRILAAQMGVGGDDSWGAPVHQEYLIPSNQKSSISFTIERI